MKYKILGIFAVVAVIALIAYVVPIIMEHLAENQRLRDAQLLVKIEAKQVVRTHGKDYNPPNDPWGTPLHWQFESDPRVNVALVISAGSDKAFDTEDDMYSKATDFNKTGLIAEWAGSKVKEGFKGFFRGLMNPAEHEASDETQKD